MSLDLADYALSTSLMSTHAKVELDLIVDLMQSSFANLVKYYAI